MARCRRRQHRRPAGPFDAAYYLGSEEQGIPPRFNPVEFEIMMIGTLGLLMAMKRPLEEFPDAARAVAEYSRHRFRR